LLIVFPRNRGKSAAVKEALRFNVDKVVLLDADLTGLTRNHALQIKQWISTYNCARIILKGGRAATTWSHMISPVLAGQRILPMAVLRKFYESSSVTGFSWRLHWKIFEEGRNKTRGTCFGRRRPNHERREARVLAGVKSTP